jgi:HD-GYP domain-containing protein (c-di-GMP phosphodiesterase class II)
MKCFNDIDFHLFVESLIKTIELKDAYTAGHSRRVSEISELICRGMNMPEDQCEYLHVTGHLHDIGKIGIADGVLMKGGRLSDAEYYLIQQHPVIGAAIFENIAGLSRMSKIIRHHHERFDGKGYPDRLKGDQIPVESSIIAIADSFDAMTTFRPYKPTLTADQAIDEIYRNKGKQFHPDICDVFFSIYQDNKDILTALTQECTTGFIREYVPFNSTKTAIAVCS